MKFIFKSILTIILVALGYSLAIQGFAPVFQNCDAKPFEGEQVFNPYSGVDFNKIIKANFHAHTMFDTRENYSEEQFEKCYSDAGYNYIGVANHNFLTNSLKHRKNNIETYEHGWNVNNYHILVLGASTNDIIDAPFLVFPRGHMQWTINRIKNDAKLLSLNHPERLRFISKDNYKQLRGYDIMEANGNNEREVWDEVLMQGNYIPLLSSDDAHSIENRDRRLFGAYTVVLADNQAEKILEAIKQGHSYGAVRRSSKVGEIHPRFKQIQVANDTLWVKLDSTANAINFIDNAKIVKSKTNANNAAFALQNLENYVRIEAIYDSVTLVSNPIARSIDGLRPQALPLPQINTLMTTLNAIFWGVLALIDLLLIIKLWKKKKPTKKRTKDNFENYTWGIGLKTYDPS